MATGVLARRIHTEHGSGAIVFFPHRIAPDNPLLFEVENINHYEALAIHQHNVSADHSMFVAWRRWWQLLFEFVGTGPDLRTQINRQHCIDDESSLQSRGQPVTLRQAGRQVLVVLVVPAAHHFVVVTAIPVSPVVIVVTITMLVVPVRMPMSMSMIMVVIIVIG